MAINLRGRHLLTLKDFTPQEITYLLKLAADLKEKKRCGIKDELLLNKNIVLIFDKASTRTRCAFDSAIHEEGGHTTFLENSHMGHKESIIDTAKILGRFYDGIEFRGYQDTTLQLLAEHAGVPVWNGLTDRFHPTQMLGDLLTLQEYINKPLKKIKLVFAGDTRSNIARSLMIAAAKMGLHFVGLGPCTLWPESSLIAEMKKVAEETGAIIEYEESVEVGVKDADALYTDVWVSMGEEQQYAERIELLKFYQVNRAMLDKTNNPDIVFMHCLPAFHDINTEIGQQIFNQFGLREMEVTDEVFNSHHSIVFEQAENRLHTIKAVIVATIGNL
jgi:ornithine carbamoyltransferase